MLVDNFKTQLMMLIGLMSLKYSELRKQKHISFLLKKNPVSKYIWSDGAIGRF